MSERVTAVKTAMDATLATNPDVNIYPTLETVHEVGGATVYKVLLYETNINRSDGLYKWYGMGCHCKSTTAANIDNLIEDILRFDSRSVHTTIRHRASSGLIEVNVTSFYVIVEPDKFEGVVNIEGKWLV